MRHRARKAALGGGGRRTIREEAPLAIRIRVPEAFDGERLDVAIARLADGVSRCAARRLIDQGSISLDGQRTRVLSRRVHARAEIQWERARPSAPPSTQAAPRILDEAPGLLAAFKPSGMPTEPPRQASAGTLLEAVRDALRARGEAVPFLAAAHGLDVETSGIVVFAREREAAAGLGIPEDVALGNADRVALVPRKER